MKSSLKGMVRSVCSETISVVGDKRRSLLGAWVLCYWQVQAKGQLELYCGP